MSCWIIRFSNDIASIGSEFTLSIDFIIANVFRNDDFIIALIAFYIAVFVISDWIKARRVVITAFIFFR